MINSINLRGRSTAKINITSSNKKKKKTEQNRTQLWLMKDEIQYLSHEFRAKQDETERVKFGQHLTVN